MILSMNSQDLLEGLNIVTRALSSRPAKQILEGVLISAANGGDKLGHRSFGFHGCFLLLFFLLFFGVVGRPDLWPPGTLQTGGCGGLGSGRPTVVLPGRPGQAPVR